MSIRAIIRARFAFEGCQRYFDMSELANDLTIFIPALNEEDVFKSTNRKMFGQVSLVKTFCRLGRWVEIVVVSDDSADRTAAVAPNCNW
jgi:hypothetical protein